MTRGACVGKRRSARNGCIPHDGVNVLKYKDSSFPVSEISQWPVFDVVGPRSSSKRPGSIVIRSELRDTDEPVGRTNRKADERLHDARNPRRMHRVRKSGNLNVGSWTGDGSRSGDLRAVRRMEEENDQELSFTPLVMRCAGRQWSAKKGPFFSTGVKSCGENGTGR